MPSPQTASRPDAMILSYRSTRRWIGILGIALPPLVYFGTKWLGCPSAQPSISHYYYTVTGSVFVGILCAVGLFLINYKGCGPGYTEDWITNIAGACAFLIALFPTSIQCPPPEGDASVLNARVCAAVTDCRVNFFEYPAFTGNIHYTAAAGFFAAIIILCWRFFTRTDGAVTRSKRRRNRLYRTCAAIMAAASLTIVVFGFGPESLREIWPDVTFWMETVALWSFGVAWLVKGAVVLDDSPVEQQQKMEAEALQQDVGTVHFQPERRVSKPAGQD